MLPRSFTTSYLSRLHFRQGADTVFLLNAPTQSFIPACKVFAAGIATSETLTTLSLSALLHLLTGIGCGSRVCKQVVLALDHVGGREANSSTLNRVIEARSIKVVRHEQSTRTM